MVHMDAEDKKQSVPPQEEAGWQYKSVTGVEPVRSTADSEDASQKPSRETVEWTASEFVAHEKGFGWYALLVLATLIIAACLYFATRDAFAVAVAVIMAIIFGIAGSHKPRVIAYKLDRSGLTAGTRFYPYNEYKSFAMPQEGPFTGVTLLPMKRFGFPVGAYLAPDSQEKALEILSDHLPLERGELTTFEELMRTLRF